jgi:hypothetical protein
MYTPEVGRLLDLPDHVPQVDEGDRKHPAEAKRASVVWRMACSTASAGTASGV